MRHSTVVGDKITYSLWLVLNRGGSVRITREQPGLSPSERAMRLTVTLPKSIFKTPTLEGSITITDDGARDKLIADVATNAAQILKEHMALDLNLTVENAVTARTAE